MMSSDTLLLLGALGCNALLVAIWWGHYQFYKTTRDVPCQGVAEPHYESGPYATSDVEGLGCGNICARLHTAENGVILEMQSMLQMGGFVRSLTLFTGDDISKIGEAVQAKLVAVRLTGGK